MIIIRYLQTSIIIGIPVSSCFADVNHASDKETSFPVDKTGDIGFISLGSISQIIGFHNGHKNPFVVDSIIINEDRVKNHRERLNDLTYHLVIRCDSLTFMET
jgi:hypothetical protein